MKLTVLGNRNETETLEELDYVPASRHAGYHVFAVVDQAVCALQNESDAGAVV